MSQDTVQQARVGNRWVTKWIYDMDTFPSDKNTLDLVKAVFVCAAGDGEISKEERDFAFGYFDAVGIPESLHDFVKTYEGKDKLEDLIKENNAAINEDTKRCIIYTAMIVAGADGYADGEHASIVKMAKRLGVEEEIVNKIKAQYELDLKTRKERVDLLFPNHPWRKTN